VVPSPTAVTKRSARVNKDIAWDRPNCRTVRLFANMLPGHITLKIFAGFVALLGTSLGAIGWIGGILPLALTVAMTALELLVAFLQAYVFAILTCIFLNDAIHQGH
jgi:F-type H+-transporting ATPase subunit a